MSKKKHQEFDPRKASKKELVKEYEALMDICEELDAKRRRHKVKQRAAEAKLKSYEEHEAKTAELQRTLLNVGP